MSLTRVERYLKMARDIGNCKPEKFRKKWMEGSIKILLAEPERFHLTEEDREMLRQELLKYV